MPRKKSAKATQTSAGVASLQQPRNRGRFSPEDIVRAWQTSDTAKEAAEKLGPAMKIGTLRARIVFLRKKLKIPLKTMTRTGRIGYTPEYVDNLKKLAVSLNGNEHG